MKKVLTGLSLRTLFAFALFVPISIIFCGCSSSRQTKDNLVSLFSSGQQTESQAAFQEQRLDTMQNADTLQENNQEMNTQSGNYIIKQGDQIIIKVVGYSEFDTTAIVGETGTISIRLIGDLNAAGITRSQFIDQLSLKLSQYINTKFDLIVNIIDRSVQSIIILGEVARQGNYPITYDMSLLQVIAMAGGLTIDADAQHVRIMRGGDPKNATEIDITQYLKEGKQIKIPIPIIKTGDIVFIPREENLIRELSNFFRDAIFLFGFFAVAQ